MEFQHQGHGFLFLQLLIKRIQIYSEEVLKKRKGRNIALKQHNH